MRKRPRGLAHRGDVEDQLAALEADLGQIVLNRQKSGVTLTPAGTTGRTVLWCASSADQVLVDARTIRHLLAQHHRVTLATPEAAWEHVTADAESDEDRAHLLEQLAERRVILRLAQRFLQRNRFSSIN